jgi:hypothetical protein
MEIGSTALVHWLDAAWLTCGEAPITMILMGRL